MGIKNGTGLEFLKEMSEVYGCCVMCAGKKVTMWMGRGLFIGWWEHLNGKKIEQRNLLRGLAIA